jgi:methionine-S-sulfoxide reductase
MSSNSEIIVLGGGCFWCLDAGFRLVDGVNYVVSGYAGGNAVDPSYDEVCTGSTGHAEVVKITYDSSKIVLEDILDIFWAIHDPTTKNRQGNDEGTQYRSIIIYYSDKDETIIRNSIDKVNKLWSKPVITEIQHNIKFYPAEDEHQNYFNKHPERAYCQVIVNPKLAKLREKFASRITT